MWWQKRLPLISKKRRPSWRLPSKNKRRERSKRRSQRLVKKRKMLFPKSTSTFQRVFLSRCSPRDSKKMTAMLAQSSTSWPLRTGKMKRQQLNLSARLSPSKRLKLSCSSSTERKFQIRRTQLKRCAQTIDLLREMTQLLDKRMRLLSRSQLKRNRLRQRRNQRLWLLWRNVYK